MVTGAHHDRRTSAVARRAVRRVLLVARIVAAVRVLAKVATAARRSSPLTTARDASEMPQRPDGSISVVIPARDEEERLAPCLAALVGAPGVLEVIVVDDGSTDGTAALAASLGATVVSGAALPYGWAGKCWALQQGIEAARGTWIVTLDADTRPHGELPGALVARACADGLDVVSVAGRFDCPTPGARWLHAAMLTTLIHRFGVPGADTGRSDRVLFNGQCLAFRRLAFIGVGGFHAVRSSLVEDVALARHLVGLGWTVGLLDGTGVLEVRMFESFAETWTGWGRSIALPGEEPLHRQLLDIATLTAAQAAPLTRVLLHRGDVLDVALLAVRAGTLVGTRRAYSRTGVAYWLSFLADPLAVVRLVWSVARPSRTWRGRDYESRGV
jgi:dolichol-phosphate mannosyltransferase